jgi:hypothetical protein
MRIKSGYQPIKYFNKFFEKSKIDGDVLTDERHSKRLAQSEIKETGG